jgi:hypothetical protein
MCQLIALRFIVVVKKTSRHANSKIGCQVCTFITGAET